MVSKSSVKVKKSGSQYKKPVAKTANRTKKMSSEKKQQARKNYQKAVEASKPGEGKRFSALSKSIQAEGKSKKSADAIAASIGRKKYGAKKFAKMGASARKRK